MPVPVVSVAVMRAREERTWASGVTPESVIRRAGAAVAWVAQRWTRPDDPVLVLAGVGNNGEDAAVADQHLADRDTLLLRFQDPAAFGSARAWLAEHRRHPRALVIDGLFGIGLNRPIEGPWRDLVEAVNNAGLRVLAVDVPSGLNADSGEVMGVSMEAAITVTLGAVKAGLLREEAARQVGRLELAGDIGLVGGEGEGEGDAWWVTGVDFEGYPPRRSVVGHKGDYGHLAVVAGSVGYHGAAVLAARGALRARPGLVTVYTDEGCYGPVAGQLSGAMVRPWRGGAIEEERHDAWVLGPGLASAGLSPAVREQVCRIWATASGTVVADASALDWLPEGPVRSGAGRRVVTPHPGEAGRLLGVDGGMVQADRQGAVRRLAARWGGSDVMVVLKGRHTRMGGATGPVWINSTGNPGLAQGGSGDVLAGYLGGLLAQPGLRGDFRKAVAYGVWRHGAAADALEGTGRAWTVEELVEALGDPWATDGMIR